MVPRHHPVDREIPKTRSVKKRGKNDFPVARLCQTTLVIVWVINSSTSDRVSNM